VNGKLDGQVSHANTDPAAPVGDVMLGGDAHQGQQGMRGHLADLQVWRRALTDSEIKRLATIGQDVTDRSDLLARWRFSESGGNTVHDSSGNGYHGVAMGLTRAQNGPGCGK